MSLSVLKSNLWFYCVTDQRKPRPMGVLGAGSTTTVAKGSSSTSLTFSSTMMRTCNIHPVGDRVRNPSHKPEAASRRRTSTGQRLKDRHLCSCQSGRPGFLSMIKWTSLSENWILYIDLYIIFNNKYLTDLVHLSVSRLWVQNSSKNRCFFYPMLIKLVIYHLLTANSIF